ncbi:MAG: periplasmic heavy metal sensor [Candidatus Marinimicrobia bacterium]|nr:periplasmic heavy metal sensor [Candidatus Neomarinimicrobiota bacterium]
MKQKMMKRSLILLLILAFAIPVMSQSGLGKMDQSAFPQHMAEVLKLTPEQEAQMQTLRFSHQKAMIPLQADLKSEMLEVKQLKLADEPNRKKIFTQIDKVGVARIAIDKAKADHQLEIRKILSAEQYKVFRKNMHKGAEFDGRRSGQSGKCDSRQGRPHRK